MAHSIKKGDEGHEQLLNAWLGQGSPENLIVGKVHYLVVTPSDDEVVFIKQEGFENYSSRTNIPGAG